jgi:hypothetical protein
MKTRQILHVCLTAALGLATLVFNTADAGVVLLDNTAQGTASLTPSPAGLNSFTGRFAAYSFSTTTSYTLESVTLGLTINSTTAPPVTENATISLYSASSATGVPENTILAQTVISITASNTPQYYSFSLPNSFTISAGNSYALSFSVSQLSTGSVRWSTLNAGNVFPTGSNGITVNGTGTNNQRAYFSDGTTWSSGNVTPTMYLQAAAVPEPSTWMLTGIAIAGGLGYRRLRRRVRGTGGRVGRN